MSKDTLLQRFKEIRRQTEKLVEPLEVEDFVAQPIQDVSPPKWHLGHSTWFFENFILKQYSSKYQVFDKDFDFIFNSYYESQGNRILRNKRGGLTRPSTEKIFAFRKHVNLKMEELLGSETISHQPFSEFVELGLQHEQQHQELLLTDIKYILADNPLLPVYTSYTPPFQNELELDWLPIEEGVYDVGYKEEGFCFDNELGNHKTYLHAYEISNRLVSNKEFIEFIEDAGYSKPELWLSEGWEWVKHNQSKSPLYWLKDKEKWLSFQLRGLQELDLNAPVTHLNYYEADAFARWKGLRLPTEFEWEVAASTFGNLESSKSFSDGEIYEPFFDQSNPFFYGACWEWTSSDYAAYPFYKQAEGALGEYNGKFMINQKVLRGGSCATPKSHFRPTYRNFFHPHLQWQFSGLRLAKTSGQ